MSKYLKISQEVNGHVFEVGYMTIKEEAQNDFNGDGIMDTVKGFSKQESLWWYCSYTKKGVLFYPQRGTVFVEIVEVE